VAAKFEDYLQASKQQPVRVTRNGKPVAVLMAVRDKTEAKRLASPPRSLQSVFKEAHEQIDRGGGLAHDEFWKQVARSRAAKSKPSARSSGH
jgi:prevent-host-death family protein